MLLFLIQTLLSQLKQRRFMFRAQNCTIKKIGLEHLFPTMTTQKPINLIKVFQSKTFLSKISNLWLSSCQNIHFFSFYGHRKIRKVWHESKKWEKTVETAVLRQVKSLVCLLMCINRYSSLKHVNLFKTQVRFRARSESDYRIRNYQSLSSAWFYCKQRSALWEYGHDKWLPFLNHS